MSTLQRYSCKAWLFLTGLAPLSASAQGFGPIPAIPGAPSTFDKQGIRDIVLRVLYFVLDFLALIAVVFIVIAGIRLLVSQGNDDQKDKAKKTILFVILGLLVILFARVIVGFFTETVPNEL